MSQDNTKLVCYSTWGTPAMTTECGKTCSYMCTAVLSRVTCSKCLESKVFKEHTMLKELGFDGNFTEFYEHLRKLFIPD